MPSICGTSQAPPASSLSTEGGRWTRLGLDILNCRNPRARASVVISVK